MPRNKGATLIEALIGLSISLLLFLAFLGAVAPVQSLTWDLSALHDRDASLCLAPPLLYKWISGGGNHRADRAGCIKAEGKTLKLQSDTDGPEGFPDGDLDESYESISIRQKGSDLQVQIGKGAFEPVFRNISRFEAESPEPACVRLSLAGEIDRRLIRIPSPGPKQIPFELYLWNFRPNLFEETR